MGYYLDFTDQAKDDIASHKKIGNKVLLNKILNLLLELNDHAFTGRGKPDQLKYSLSGLWSRRINREHRLIYDVKENVVYILSINGQYDN